MYDRQCTECGEQMIDCLEPISAPEIACSACGAKTFRVWLTQGSSVIQDSIEGGYEVKHGLCHDDGTPRKFYSKSEMARAAKEKGLTNYVVHQPPPHSDKSKMTVRWI